MNVRLWRLSPESGPAEIHPQPTSGELPLHPGERLHLTEATVGAALVDATNQPTRFRRRLQEGLSYGLALEGISAAQVAWLNAHKAEG